MIELIVVALENIGVAERFRRLAAWAIIVIGCVLLILAAIWLIRSSVDHHTNTAIQQHDDQLNVEATSRAAEAMTNAYIADQQQTEQNAKATTELNHEASKGDGSSVGPGVGGVMQRMREQQAAHRR